MLPLRLLCLFARCLSIHNYYITLPRYLHFTKILRIIEKKCSLSVQFCFVGCQIMMCYEKFMNSMIFLTFWRKMSGLMRSWVSFALDFSKIILKSQILHYMQPF